MSETAEKAKSLFESPKPYHPAARLTLPVLVRQARASETIQYSAVAAEVGVSRPRNMGYPLGSIGQTLLELGRRWRQTIPPIQAIVVNKADGLPGVGVAHFTPDAKVFKSATRQEKRRIVLEILHEVFTYRDWDRVLRALGLQPLSTPELPPVDTIARRGGGEGPEHLALKQLISECPHSVGAEGMTPEVEASLHSGDFVDVLFRSRRRVLAIEVKGEQSANDDVVRGLFQCVKYQAVLDAQAKIEGVRMDVAAVLALGGRLPDNVRAIANTLGIQVIDQLSGP